MATPPEPAESRTRAGAQTTLIGGLVALVGWIFTGGDGAWDVIGVVLLVAALIPTIGGLAMMGGGSRGTRS